MEFDGDASTNTIIHGTGSFEDYEVEDFTVTNYKVEVLFEVGESDPGDDYEVEYYENGEYTGTSPTSSLARFDADAGSEAIIKSYNSESDQVWMVGSSQLSGRGTQVSFKIPTADCGFTVTRSEQTVGGTVIVNTLSDFTGGMSGYTSQDFSIN